MADSTTKLTVAQKIEKARAALEGLNRAEVNPEGVTEDVRWHGALVRELRGRDAVVAGLRQQRSGYEEFLAEPHAILADDDHTVALVNLKLRAGGKDLNAQQVIVLHTNEQGQISEMWSMLDADTLKQLAR